MKVELFESAKKGCVKRRLEQAGRLGVWAFGIGRWVSHSINLKLVWTLGLPPSLPFPRTGLEFEPVWETGVRDCCLGLDV